MPDDPPPLTPEQVAHAVILYRQLVALDLSGVRYGLVNTRTLAVGPVGRGIDTTPSPVIMITASRT